MEADHSIVAGAVILKSVKLEALHQYFNRLVTNLLDRKICYKDKNGKIQPVVSQNEIAFISQSVENFSKSIEEHSLITSGVTHVSRHIVEQRDGRILNLKKCLK